MKKLNIVFLMFLCLFAFVGCKNKNENEYLLDISFEELQDKLNNQQTFFFEVVQDGCSFCEAYTPKLKEVLSEYKITGYSINMSDMTDDEYQQFGKLFNISTTPNTVFITNGSEISVMQRISGNVSKTKIVSKLEANGYIKEQ